MTYHHAVDIIYPVYPISGVHWSKSLRKIKGKKNTRVKEL